MPTRERDLTVPSNSPSYINDKLGLLSDVVSHLGDTGLLDADAISGVVQENLGGTGSSAYTDGQLLIGNGQTKGLDPATITAGTNVTVTNGHGTITIAAVSGSGLGDVLGPASATANDIAIFNGTTGKVIKDAGKGVPVGAIVGTTDSQTLSAKTLTTPTIGDFSNATHGHQNAAGGGGLDAAAVASGQIVLARGGTGSDLSATGGTHQVLQQSSLGAVVSVGQLAASDISGLAASATTDTTNASNISSGTLPAGRLPNPSSTTLGGIESAAAVSHQWIDSISTSGVPHLSQPAFTDVSGSVAAGQMPALTGDVTTSAGAVATTLASVSITSGTTGDASHVAQITTNAKGLVTAQSSVAIVITPTAAGLSNVTNDAQTKAAVVPNTAPSSGQILVGNAGGTAYAPQSMSSDATIASTGALTIAAGSVTLAKQANMATASLVYRKTAGSGAPEVNTLATLKTDLGLTGTNSGDQVVPANTTSTASNYFTAYNSTTGAFTKAQPAFTDVSGSVAASQMPALTGDITTSAGAVATAIGTGKVTNAMLAGSIAASKLVGSDIATVGTITSGTWTGTTIAVANGGTGLTTTAWLTRTFSAGNFTGNGSMTWTVDAGDVTTDAYLQIGKSVWYSFYLVSTTVGGTPNNALQIKLPNSITANRTMVGNCRVDDAGAVAMSWCRVQAAATNLEIFLNAAAGNYSAGTNNVTVTGQIFFEAQ